MGDVPNLQPGVVVHLSHPIMVKGREVSELTLRRPTLGLLLQLNDLGLQIEDKRVSITGLGTPLIRAAAHLAGISEAETMDIDLDDLGPLLEVVKGFFASSGLTGLIASPPSAPPSA